MSAGRYQCILAVSAVFIFFTKLDIYLYDSGVVSFPPLVWIIAFGIASAPLLLSHSLLTVVRQSPFAGWCYGFVMLSGAWLFFQSLQSDLAWREFRIRILSACFLLMLFFIFSKDDVQLCARRAILAAVLIAVAFNIYELFHPGEFSYVSGRSAGLYINPNSSGVALNLGLIFSVGLLPHKYRVPLVMLVGLGVFLTLSRTAITGWAIVVLVMALTGEIPLRKPIIIWCAVLTMALVLLLPWWGELLYQLEDSGALNADVVERLEWFKGLQNLDVDASDYSGLERKEVAGIAWKLFADKPVLGRGVGASMDWDFQVSSHNQYLNLMVDHGIVGFFILPLLVLAVMWRARGEAKYIGFALAVFVLYCGIFSHNMLENRYILTALSLSAAMSLASVRGQKFGNINAV